MANKENPIPKWFVIVFIAWLTIMFAMGQSAFSADASWRIYGEAGDIYDSITYEHYMGGSSSPDSSGLICTTCTGYSGTLTVSDSLYHFYYLYFWEDTMKGSWGFFKSPSDTAGVPTTVTVPIRAYWLDAADYSGLSQWSYDGISLQTSNVYALNADSTYHFKYNYTHNTDEMSGVFVAIDFPGVDSNVSWQFQVEPSILGGFGIVSPSAADLALVYGWVKDMSDNPVQGARIDISRVTTGNSADTSVTTPVIISPKPIVAYTDTAGYWQIYLRRTTAYSDTTLGFYNIVCNHGGSKIFDFKKLRIPGSGNLNLGDSLAVRQQ